MGSCQGVLGATAIHAIQHPEILVETPAAFDIAKQTASTASLQPAIHVACLHGQGSNKIHIEHQPSAIKAALGETAEFVFIPAPHATKSSYLSEFYEGMDWYEWLPRNSHSASEVNALIAYAMQQLEQIGHIDVLLGFSQGAMVVELLDRLAQTSSIRRTWRLSVLCSGISLLSWQLPGLLAASTPHDVPSIHIFGTNEHKEVQTQLPARYAVDKRAVIKHAAGHDIPRVAEFGGKVAKAIAAAMDGEASGGAVRLLSRKRDALAEAVRGLKKEVLLERDARFVVEKCLNERLCKMELELEFRDNEIVRLHDRQRRFDALDIDLDRPDDDGCLPPYQAPGSRIAAPPAHARCPLRRSQPSRQSLAIITATTTAAASAAPAIASSELSPDDIEFEHAASDHGSHADADADSDADSDASPVHPPDSHDHDDHVVDQDGSNDNNNEIKPAWAHAGFRPRDPAAVAACSASPKHDDEDFGYGSEESASATVSPPRSFAEHSPEQIFQALLANVQPSMLHVDIDDFATTLAAPAHDCLTAILDALVRICDLYSTLISRFIDDEDDQLFALFALERLRISVFARLPFFAKFVMVLFQLELVESDAVVAWHDSRAPSKDPLDVRSQTRAFVQWLKEHDDYDNKDKDIDPEDAGLSIDGLEAELLVPRLFIDNLVDCVRTDSHSSSGSRKRVTFAA
ncbi:hypothetical protein HK105_207837 [Polyrhizophydium stewartii]|uniref:W2 domain-containing protein n=1 Tax=Polyrhizophydium stewartii TaxID=2732419 RepID=A0ABR4MZD6_9FUNG